MPRCVDSLPKNATAEETAFNKNLCDELQRLCNISPNDVMVSIVGNTDKDWSFGLGRAQFLNDELGADRKQTMR